MLIDLKNENNSNEYQEKNFIKLEFIGKGEFGNVYKAFDKTLNKFVALKYVEINLTMYDAVKNLKLSDLDSLIINNKKKDFINFDYSNEGKLLKKVSEIDANFIRYYGVYENERADYKKELIFSMELGKAALSDIIFYRKKYPEDELLCIISDLVKQLKLAQKNHICHGDIKLADVIVCFNDIQVYKLIDFGFGHFLPNDKLKFSEIKGFSSLYASPELKQAILRENNGNFEDFIDPYKSEIFAIGVVMLKLMGCSNDKIESIQRKPKKQSFDGQLRKDYPNSYDLVKNLFNFDPTKRFSYQEMLDRLAQFPKKTPNDKLYIKNFKEKQRKAMMEIDLEKYVNLFYDLKNYKKSRKYCYFALNIIKGKNNKREAYWREKCGDIEKKLGDDCKEIGDDEKFYKLSEDSYCSSISRIMKSDDSDDMNKVIEIQNKRIKVKELKSKLLH